MISERFDVVVAFPFGDSAKRKPGPGLGSLRLGFQSRQSPHVLAMITRAGDMDCPSDHAIRDLSSTGLRHASVVRWKLLTLDNRIIPRRIGRLEREDRNACAGCLAPILGLARSSARPPA